MSAEPVQQQTERQRLMEELYADLRAGRVVKNSTEWHRRRSRALRADPAILERKRAAEREAYRRNTTRRPWAQYVEDVRAKAEARRAARDARAAEADRNASKRMARASSEPRVKAWKRAEYERIAAVVREIQAEEKPCPAITWRGGFRVSCVRSGEHRTHVGIYGDRF